MKLEIIKLVICLFVYLISIYGAKQVNKYAYLKADATIVPISWYLPIINTATIFTLVSLMLLSTLLEKINTAEYYKNKWNYYNKS